MGEILPEFYGRNGLSVGDVMRRGRVVYRDLVTGGDFSSLDQRIMDTRGRKTLREVMTEVPRFHGVVTGRWHFPDPTHLAPRPTVRIYYDTEENGQHNLFKQLGVERNKRRNRLARDKAKRYQYELWKAHMEMAGG